MPDPGERILRLIADPAAESFEALALDLFRHQVEVNPAYRAWCVAAGTDPGRLRTVGDIPAVPVAAFKELEFVCGTPTAEFRTSGTTGTGRGRHLLPELDTYRTGALAWFGACVMPEGWRLRTFVLAPPPAARPYSSLSRMLGWILEVHGEPGSGWFVGPDGLETDRLVEGLLDAQRAGGPVLVLATSAALQALLDALDRDHVRIALPGGSRLMDTGGQKGTGATAPAPPDRFQARLYARAAALLGVPAAKCVNEYGMTELSSQAYDETILHPEVVGAARVKRFPHWVRVATVDPVTMSTLPPGETGLLRILDLANRGSVAHVLTEDLGAVTPDGGILLHGRPAAAEARGCGLTFAELTRLAGGPR